MSVFRGPVAPVSQRARKLRALGALRSATPQSRSISIEGWHVGCYFARAACEHGK